MPRINVRVMIQDRGELALMPLSTGTPGAAFGRTIDWPEHFEVVEPFSTIGPSNLVRRFFFFLRPGTGTVHIHPVSDDGRLGTRAFVHDWTSGWTSAAFTASGAFVVILKASTGKVHVHAVSSNGSIGRDPVQEQEWSQGWTELRTFTVGGSEFVFALKQGSGIAKVVPIGPGGQLGQTLHQYDWSSGWTRARLFRAGGNLYLFLLKSASGLVHIHRMAANAGVGARQASYEWSHQTVSPLGFPEGANWTDVEFFEGPGGATHMLILKEDSGDVHVHRMNGGDGSVGPRIYDGRYSVGWSAARTYRTAQGPFLLLQKALGRRPLRRTFVEHVAFGVPIGLYLTDDDGHVRDGQNDRGILNPTDKIDIRVLCHNAVVRLPNGPIDHWRDFTGVSDDDTVTIRDGSDNYDRFRVLNRCVETYDNVFRPMEPFDGADFPLRPGGGLSDRKGSSKRIEVAYPDVLPQPLAFVEPIGITNEYPIIHLKKQQEDPRLFGGDGAEPELIPAELAHALHFSVLTRAQRQQILRDFGFFLVSDFLARGDLTHNLSKQTTPTVAFLEALDHFSHRFAMFVRHSPGRPIDAQLYRDYIAHEFTKGIVATIAPGALGTAAVTPADGLRGGDIEGAVFGAIYLDWARRPGIGLRRAVSAVLKSRTITCGQFMQWVEDNEPPMHGSLSDVADAWGL